MTARDFLAAVQHRADAATEGPWLPDGLDANGDYWVNTGYSNAFETGFIEEDAEFIAASRTDVPRLVAALTAALDLADSPRNVVEASGGGLIRGERVVRPHDLRAAITAALTPKENDS